jgi:hypothetical protein
MNDIDARASGVLARRRIGCDRIGVATRLSVEERRKREDAVRFANASIALEGFKVSAEEQARSDRFITGEIDLGEFLKGE